MNGEGKGQHNLQGWVERSDTLWEMMEVNWYGALFTPPAG